MIDCKLKGDTTNDASTAGLVAIDADVHVENCNFQHFKSGGIMVQAKPQNKITIQDNEIISCDTAGIYIQGKQSRPYITGNSINFCRCAAINTNLDVQASIVRNQFNLNEVGIEVYNNQSHIIENEIERSHENGIKITGTNRAQLCTAKIWKNNITSCGYNGLVIQGGQCNPDVRGNVIKANRKAGIKLTEEAIAHIGGTEKADIKFIPTGKILDQVSNNTFMTAKKEAIRTFAGGSQHGGTNYLGITDDAMSATNQTPDDLALLDYRTIVESAQLRVKSFPNANVISHNYNQGILVVEGSSAIIIANKIEHNIKANIALGGEKTSKTRIMYNYIFNSKSGEGIFVVEGEEELLIEDN